MVVHLCNDPLGSESVKLSSSHWSTAPNVIPITMISSQRGMSEHNPAELNPSTQISTMVSPIIFLTLLSALLIHMSPSFVTADVNVLVTGETIGTDGQLYYDGVTLAVQSDCNLVLYDREGQPKFQSNTAGRGANCTLSFTTNCRLILRQSNGTTTWVTPNFFSRNGTCAAVVRPDGHVAIYGHKIWSLDAIIPSVENPKLGNLPPVHNVLFSGQVLYNGGKLRAGAFSLIMKNDCNLYLEKAGVGVLWKSKTSQSCKGGYLRLGHTGKLAIVSDQQVVVWSSENTFRHGEYVLVIRINGDVSIFGPVIWSTAGTAVGESGAVAVE